MSDTCYEVVAVKADAAGVTHASQLHRSTVLSGLKNPTRQGPRPRRAPCLFVHPVKGPNLAEQLGGRLFPLFRGDFVAPFNALVEAQIA